MNPMKTIVLKKSWDDSGFDLIFCDSRDLIFCHSRDLISVNILYLTEVQARAIAGDHTGIHFLHQQKFEGPDVTPQSILIERVLDRKRGLAWQMRIGNDLVMNRRWDGTLFPCRISDENVQNLEKFARVSFEPGQPDWALRQVEDLEDDVARAQVRLALARDTAPDWVLNEVEDVDDAIEQAQAELDRVSDRARLSRLAYEKNGTPFPRSRSLRSEPDVGDDPAP